MTPRARRLLVIGGAVVLLLVLGRILAVLLTDRWWAAAISDAAADTVTRWTVYGWLLDAAAMLLASAWFAGNGLLVVRGIASVTVASRVGQEEVPVAVSPRILRAWAVGVGVLLGVIVGTGARTWRAPFALGWEGVRFGAIEPLSNADLGSFVGLLPAWLIAHDFVTTLLLLGLALVLVLYTLTGGVRRQPGGLLVHPHSRRHLGALLTLLALVVSVGALLHPWTSVAALTEPLPLVAARVRGMAAQAMFGAALAVAIMTFTWTLRGRHSLLVAGWLVLGIALGVERILIPALTAPTAPVESADADIRAATERMWGVTVLPTPRTADTLPPVTGRWDPTTLRRAVDGRGATLLAATPALTRVNDSTMASWHLVIGPQQPGAGAAMLTVRDEIEPLREAAPGLASLAGGDIRLRPSAPAWQVTASGVSTDGVVRRLLLAWGRQASGLLRRSATGAVDWHLDPTARAATLLPMVSWLPADIAVVEGRPLWLVQGVIPVERYPLAARGRWAGRDVAGAMPAFVAVMEPATGAVTVYRDPGADSLAASWARIIGPLIQPEGSMPAGIRDALRYPKLLFEAQVRVLEGAAWQFGRRPGRRVADGPPEEPVPIWTSHDGPGWQSVLEDPTRLTISAILTATRHEGRLRLTVSRHDGQGGPENGRELERRWNRLPGLIRLRDSSRAAQDSVIAGTVRWYVGPAGLVAWQPIVAAGRFGRVSALGIAVASGEKVAMAREPAAAWGELLADGRAAPPQVEPGQEVERWRKAREWMARADSALARGDLTAFGRAFEALRGLLQEPPPK
jgi:hypothetical protein